MFNSPILDLCIGLIFIYLLFSLLATSINEGLATIFALRAHMLREAIVEGMFRPEEQRNKNPIFRIKRGLQDVFANVGRITLGLPYKYTNNKLGEDFYNHAVIKKLGRQKQFSLPSYLPEGTFSLVFTNILEDYYTKHRQAIADYQNKSPEEMDAMSKTSRFELLFKYLQHLIDKGEAIDTTLIDKETLKVLNIYLKESYHNIDTFIKNLETWYNNTMDRVSGWYKRQTQYILFATGIFIAVAWNVDIITVSQTLSKDKTQRTALANVGTTYAQNNTTLNIQQSTEEIAKQIDEIAPFIPIGWKYEMFNRSRADLPRCYQWRYDDFYRKAVQEVTLPKDLAITTSIEKAKRKLSELHHKKAMSDLYEAYPLRLSFHYFFHTFSFRKITGYLLLALGICLGAPFWFDLLQKVTRLRATGKKTEDTATTTNTNTAPTVQVTLNQNTGDDKPIG